MSKMLRYYINEWILNIKMTSIYNKLWDKQDEFCFWEAHICKWDKAHQMNLKKHTNHFISWNHARIIVTF
jgi:hypothetical protein